MAIPRDTTKQQFDLERQVYGSLPVEGMPLPDLDQEAIIAYWHKDVYGSGQWTFARIVAGTGIDISFDNETGDLTITNSDYIKYGSVTVDAVIMPSFTADAVLV